MYFLRNFNKNLTVLCFDTVLQTVHRIPRKNPPLNFPLIYCLTCSPVQWVHTSTFLCKSRMKDIKEAQKNIEYVSPKKRKPVVEVWEGMTIEELGYALGKNADHVFELMEFVDNTAHYNNPNDVLDWTVLNEIVGKAYKRAKLRPTPTKEDIKDRDLYPYPPAPEDKLVKRPPVVTIMGHVDHGKTTLLDYLRKSSIVDSEFGGITQRIGAFSVKMKSESVTFLDTPGHAAFKAMRSRGAHCTDIVVLVVAADDGVMEQTQESIRMARDARVPIIVAINKIDKYNADIELTKQMLAAQQLVAEDMGGDVQVIPISALKGTNVDQLVEAILVQADMSNLRSDPDGFVEGYILESRVDPHIGKLASALVRRGTMRKGTVITAGQAWCKVRFLLDDRHKQTEKAPPSAAVEVAGWKELPLPGDLILEVKTEKQAHEVVMAREKKSALKKALEEFPSIELKNREHKKEYKKLLLEKRKLGVVRLRRKGPKPKEFIETKTGPVLSVVIKADVEGSLEALLDALETYHNPLCKLDIVHFGVGAVSKNDIDIAEIFDAIVYNFNIGVQPEISEIVKQKNITIRPHNIIYRFLEDVRDEINSRLPAREMEEVTGEAVVLKIFYITDGKKKNVPVAGCRCVKGDLKKTSVYRVLRNDQEVYRGTLHTMRNLKTEVTSIKKEQECGLRFEDSSFIFEPGDVIQSVQTYTVPQNVDWNPFGSIR